MKCSFGVLASALSICRDDEGVKVEELESAAGGEISAPATSGPAEALPAVPLRPRQHKPKAQAPELPVRSCMPCRALGTRRCERKSGSCCAACSVYSSGGTGVSMSHYSCWHRLYDVAARQAPHACACAGGHPKGCAAADVPQEPASLARTAISEDIEGWRTYPVQLHDSVSAT
jgi:hypothetical protein